MLLRNLGNKRTLDRSARMRELSRVLRALQTDESVTDLTLHSVINGRFVSTNLSLPS
jgi:hypothetical protein